MTDTELLSKKIEKSGLKKIWIAENLGITVNGLRKKITNKSGFYADEISKLCKMLAIDTEAERTQIFFCQECR